MSTIFAVAVTWTSPAGVSQVATHKAKRPPEVTPSQTLIIEGAEGENDFVYREWSRVECEVIEL